MEQYQHLKPERPVRRIGRALLDGLVCVGGGMYSIAEGMSSLNPLARKPVRPNQNEHLSEDELLAQAWRQVGDDIRSAMQDIDNATRQVLGKEEEK